MCFFQQSPLNTGIATAKICTYHNACQGKEHNDPLSVFARLLFLQPWRPHSNIKDEIPDRARNDTFALSLRTLRNDEEKERNDEKNRAGVHLPFKSSSFYVFFLRPVIHCYGPCIVIPVNNSIKVFYYES